MNADVFLYFIFITAKLLFFNSIIDGTGMGSIPLIASVAGTVLLLFFWAGLLPGKIRLPLLFMLDCAVTFIIIADLLFFRYFSDVLSMPVLEQASVVTSVKSSILNLLHASDLIFAADLLFLPFVSAKAGRLNKKPKAGFGKRIICALSALAIGIGLCGCGVSELLKAQPEIFRSFYDRVYIVQNIGLLGFHGIDAFRYVKSKDKSELSLSEDIKKEIAEFIKDKKPEQPSSPKLFGTGKGKNLIVVQVEALQEFVIGKSIEGQEITPNLNKLIKSSLYFDNYYTQTAGEIGRAHV